MSSPAPLVTVAMPVYNGAAHLERALELIRSQTYDNLEIILLDNGSTDATPDICSRAAREDSRVRVIRHPENLGPTPNFNRGILEKSGQYFMWAAHDDEKAPEFVAECLQALERNPSAVMACTWTTLMTRAGEQVHRPYSPAISSRVLSERLSAFVADRQCVAFYGLFRSGAIDAIGLMDPYLDGDRRYLFRAAIQGPFEVVEKTLFRFRMLSTLDDYLAAGYALRPGAADFDLDLYRYFPRMLAESGIHGAEYQRSVAGMRATLHDYFETRAAYLISCVLSGRSSRQAAIRRLFSFARQYPPLLRNRMFWGAHRRLLLG